MIKQNKSPGYLMSKEAKPDYVIILEVTKQFYDECLEMLEYIKRTADIGHSFGVVVDPDDKKYKKEFYVDGDGWSQIHKITTEKK